MVVTLFYGLVIAHILVGAVGLVSFWAVVAAPKGAPNHRKWGFLFARAMLATGAIAIGISLVSISAPLATHKDFTDAALARGLFGWMMLYLALLTVSLAWHALAAVRNKASHGAHRTPLGIGLQLAVFAAAVNCALHGWLLNQPLMIGIAVIGIASSALTLWFIARPPPSRIEYVLEHIRSGVGAGISAYTAFLSVGLVRAFPEYAFNPAVWSVPTIVGVSLILYYQRAQRRRRLAAAAP